MNKVSKKTKEILIREFTKEEVINVILYMVILVMPFIVNFIESPMYITGKIYFLFICASLILILGFKKESLSWCLEQKVALVFLLTIFISSIFSPFKEMAFLGNLSRYEGFITYVIYIILFIFTIKYIVINKKIVNIMFIVANIMAFYSLFQFYGIDPIQKLLLGEIVDYSSIGTIGNRNFLSTYICIFLFMTMAIYILKGGRRYLLFSIPLFSALLCTLTRGGWVAFLVYSVVGLVLIIKRKECLKRAIGIFLIFIMSFVIINLTSNNQIINRADKSLIVSEEGEIVGSVSARVKILKISWKAFLQKPLLGTGPDTLDKRLNQDFPEEQLQYFIIHKSIIDKAHNEYLELAVSCGIFTLIAYLILIFLIIKGLIKNIDDDRNKILLLTLIGYLVQAFFNISVIMVAPLFWIFLGYCVKVKYEDFKK